MPFSHKRGRRARVARSQRVTKRKRMFARGPNPAAALKNVRTGGFLGLELKFKDNLVVDTTITATNNATNGVIDPVSGDSITVINEGSGETERNGRKVLVKELHVFGQIESDGTVATSTSLKQAFYYIAMVLDTQTNGAQMTSELCYKNIAALIENAASPARNIEFESRFKVLKWKVLRGPPLSTLAATSSTAKYAGFQIPFSLKVAVNLPITFNGTDPLIANVVDNSVHVVCWASNLELGPKLTYSSRIRFIG